jgi:septal ring factor EnvC (AmiA/AmiB activator)
MPRPKSEREAWQEELNELPALIASHQSELDATRVEDKDRRENLQGRIRRDEKRMADLRKRLAG